MYFVVTSSTLINLLTDRVNILQRMLDRLRGEAPAPEQEQDEMELRLIDACLDLYRAEKETQPC